MKAPLSKLNVGVIGLGNHAREVILPALYQIPAVRIKAVSDIDLSKIAAFAPRSKGVKCYEHFEDMLLSTKLDAVVCCSYPLVHEQALLLAIQNDIAIFVEKPPSLSLKELTRISDYALERFSLTGVGMNFRWSAPFLQLQSDIRMRPELLQSIHVSYFCKRRALSHWGDGHDAALFSDAIHAFDMVNFLLPSAGIENLSSRISEHGVCCNVGGSSSNSVDWSLVFSNKAPRFAFEILMLANDASWRMVLPVSLVHDSGASSSGSTYTENWGCRTMDLGYRRAGYLTQLERFFDCVKENAPFSPSVTDLLPTYSMIETTIRRAKT